MLTPEATEKAGGRVSVLRSFSHPQPAQSTPHPTPRMSPATWQPCPLLPSLSLASHTSPLLKIFTVPSHHTFGLLLQEHPDAQGECSPCPWAPLLLSWVVLKSLRMTQSYWRLSLWGVKLKWQDIQVLGFPTRARHCTRSLDVL